MVADAVQLLASGTVLLLLALSLGELNPARWSDAGPTSVAAARCTCSSLTQLVGFML